MKFTQFTPFFLITFFISLTFSHQTFAETAYFAGGCFWCIESDLEQLKGISEVISGYSGGETKNPTYKQVSSGNTKHIESIKVIYSESNLNYESLLQKFLVKVDVTDNQGQFVDRGPHYRPVIFYETNEQKEIIDRTLNDVQMNKKFKQDVVIDVLKFKSFYDAEDYHQDYYKKNPYRYKLYRAGSGRDRKINSLWKNFKFKKKEPLTKKTKEQKVNLSWDNFKKPSLEELKKTLTQEQFDVSQKDATERPFANPYWDNKKEGIYVDVVSGEPLFSSKHKYDSGTGWPSFWKPIEEKFIVKKRDFKMLLPRTEVRSKFGDSHLGHVFKDGPEPTGLRYCMNSASMRFIPKEKMKEENYEAYLKYID